MAASMLGRRDSPTSGDQPANRGMAEAAFDFLANPMNMFRRNGGANQEIGMFNGANSNMEISRLSLHYSSANLSEEESSSLINILDRKKYHERLSATRSAEE